MDIQRIKYAIEERLRGLKTFLPSTVTVVGSYNTLNAGDRILCDAVAKHLISKGHSVQIQSKRLVTSIRSKYIVVCGGDILHDSNNKNWNFLTYLSQSSSKVFFIGAGVPGFYLKDRAQVKQILSCFELITTRDQKGYETLKALGLSNTFRSVDNAFLIQDKLRFRESGHPTKTVVLNIKAYISSTAFSKWKQEKGISLTQDTLEDYILFWKALIAHFKMQGYVVENVSMTKNDKIFSDDYFSHILDVNHPFTMDYYKISQIISKASKVVSTRYHFLILSLLNNKEILAYAYADKAENVLDDLGIHTYVKRGQLAKIRSILTKENEYFIAPHSYKRQVKGYGENHYLITNNLW